MATSPNTSASSAQRRERPMLEPRPSAFSACSESARLARSVGPAPMMRPVASASPIVKNAEAAPNSISLTRGSVCGEKFKSVFRLSHASTHAVTPPAAAKSIDSESSIRKSCRGPAPKAMRTASSFSRAHART